MCGIAGMIVSPPDRGDRAFVPLALEKLAHRGPDDHGYLLYSRCGVRLARDWRDDLPDAEAALAHRRLSIIDLTEAGRQPMASADGRYYIVFNGEIYNYLELREELEGLGHTFHSRSDTEVLLTACARWGTAALSRLVGMFAFAVLDTQERRLLLARDFFGIKPLYYVEINGRFAFASELKVLLEFAGRPRRINPERLYQYLRYGYTDHGGETFLNGVRQIPPAHYLEVSLDRLDASEPVCYWDVDLTARADISFEEAARRTRELFLENMRLHLSSDVPVGTALSGGIDSSAIVLAMRELGGKDLDLHTFSYVADDAAVSEERWVDLVTQAAGTVAHKVRPVPEELLADLDSLIYSQDEPFGSTRIYAQYRVFRLAREAGIKVMLDGQGADEILGGYRFYLAARLASLIRQGRWVQAAAFLRRASKWPGAGKRWLLAWSGEYLLPQRWQTVARRWVGKDLMPSWMNAAWFRDRGVEGRAINYSRTGNVLKGHLYRSLISQNLPHLLRYEDRNSMAFSIESRVPFLTPKFVEFLFSLPEEYIIAPDGTSKAVFRAAMRGIVPDAILDRRDKLGFVTPERGWMAALYPWVERTLQSETAARIGALNLDEAARVWNEYKATGDHFSMRVWRWINLIEWARWFDVSFD